MTAYYNEFDPFAAQWLRNLIAENLIAPGDVDERSIVDVRASDLAGYSQCHFFAGIGGWSYALRLAGWPDDRPVWTGSCPCQPFSAAGKGGGFDDERHLWPAFHWLIDQCRPETVFGEQVASKDGLAWLDLVQADLEASGYASAAADIGAAGVGAPHIRQRLYWVADTMPAGWPERWTGSGDGSVAGGGTSSELADAVRGRTEHTSRQGLGAETAADGSHRGLSRQRLRAGIESELSELADADQGQRGRVADGEGRQPDRQATGRQQSDGEPQSDRAIERMGIADSGGRETGREAAATVGHGSSDVATGGAGIAADAGSARLPLGPQPDDGRGTVWQQGQAVAEGGAIRRPGPTNGFWRNADWLGCTDGKWRPVEPGSKPLVDGLSFKLGSGEPLEGKSRVGMLRGYGNAIVPQVAAEFIAAYMDICAEGEAA